MHIVRVNWYDARSIDGWCKREDFDEELSLIHSCGFLIKENDEAMFVSACKAVDEVDGNQYACTIVIPKKMIKDIYRIADAEIL